MLPEAQPAFTNPIQSKRTNEGTAPSRRITQVFNHSLTLVVIVKQSERPKIARFACDLNQALVSLKLHLFA